MAGAPKGSRNNPNGRPPKNRALTEILLKTLNRTQLVDGRRVANKRLLAALVVEAVTSGQVTFTLEDGEIRVMVLGTHEWSEMVKWAYTFLEPPVQKSELTGQDGGPLKVIVEYADSDTDPAEAA